MALNLIRKLPGGPSSLAPCLSIGAMLLSIGLSLALPASLPPSLFTGLKLLGVLGMCSQASTVDKHLYTLFSPRHVALRLVMQTDIGGRPSHRRWQFCREKLAGDRRMTQMKYALLTSCGAVQSRPSPVQCRLPLPVPRRGSVSFEVWETFRISVMGIAVAVVKREGRQYIAPVQTFTSQTEKVARPPM